MPEEKVFLSHKTRRMKHEKRAPKNEAPSFHLADFIAGKLLLSRAYVLFKPALYSKKFSNQSHQLFLTTLPKIKKNAASEEAAFRVINSNLEF
jgi:hypothetical protein